MVCLTFVLPDGVSEQRVEAEIGQSLLDVARAQGIDAIEGACEGAMACSTCHVILDEEAYDCLVPPSEHEEDLLDLAYGARPTSRLGCQVLVSADMEGLVIRLPKSARNLMF